MELVRPASVFGEPTGSVTATSGTIQDDETQYERFYLFVFIA